VACISLAQFAALSEQEKIGRFMAAIRWHESRNNYSAQNPKASASGAYQFIDKTWQGLLKQYNVPGPPRAVNAPREMQDYIAGKVIADLLKKYKNNLMYVGVWWYWPRAYSHPEDLDIVPMPTSGNRETVRQFGNTIANWALCGVGAGEKIFFDDVFFYEWKQLPICVTTPRTGGEDVKQLKQIFGITEGPDLYGTALQYQVIGLQVDNGLPVTGCFGEKEAALISETLSSGDVTYDPISSDGLIQKVLNHPHITFDGSYKSDIAKGVVTLGKRYYYPERMLKFMLAFAQNHKYNVSALSSDHSLYISGTNSVSLHKYAKALDINYIDGHHLVSTPVKYWNTILDELVSMPAEYRPKRIGMTDFSNRDDSNGVIVFKNSGHRNHFHSSF
jgi:CO dehydrogenase/acetyl-CoA synthase epsilon subunit